MKKITILIFYFAFSSICLAQTQAICIYKVSSNEIILETDPSEGKSVQRMKNQMNEAVAIAETFSYTLKFNKNESVFSIENSMKNDAQSSYLQTLAKILVGRGAYYQNQVENQSIHQSEISGGTFLITDSFLTDWEITKETKKIGKYQCFKAIKKCIECNTYLEIWFTPEIPVPYGPLGYSGLPGLILEVRKKLLTLRLKSIDFKPKDLVIDPPTKGKVVTKQEFKEITMGLRAQMTEGE